MGKKFFGNELNKRALTKIKFLPKEYAQLQETVIIADYVGIAIFTESKHFAQTILVTILMGDDTVIKNILSEILSISKKQNITYVLLQWIKIKSKWT